MNCAKQNVAKSKVALARQGGALFGGSLLALGWLLASQEAAIAIPYPRGVLYPKAEEHWSGCLVWRVSGLHGKVNSVDVWVPSVQPQRFTITWVSHGRRCSQAFSTGEEWSPLTPGDYSDPLPVLLWRAGSHPVLVVMEQVEGTRLRWMKACAFELRGNRWVALPFGGRAARFNLTGSCYFTHSHAYVWDVDYDGRSSYWSPQHYRLLRYELNSRDIRLASIRETYRRYTPQQNEPVVFDPSPKHDPLREFGLHWMTWGPPTPTGRD